MGAAAQFLKDFRIGNEATHGMVWKLYICFPGKDNEIINVNVNVYVYSLDIPFSRVQQTAQFTPLVSELTLIRSHLLWGEFSAFSAANDISQCHFTFHNSPFFRSTRYPSLLGGQRRSGMRGFAQHLYTQVTSVI